jgi:hypothetical protein
MKPEKYRPWLSLQGAEGLVRKSVGNDENSAASDLVRAAVSVCEAASKISSLVPDILANKMSSPLANNTAARAAIAKIVEPCLRRVGIAVDYAHGAIGALTAQSDPKAPQDVVAAVQHQEVRTALAKMPLAARHAAIQNAIASGDETFLSAATSGSPTLSGMTADEQRAARAKWRSSRHPDVAARIVHLQNGLGQIKRLAPMLKKWSDQLVSEPSPQTVAAAEESAARARAASG